MFDVKCSRKWIQNTRKQSDETGLKKIKLMQLQRWWHLKNPFLFSCDTFAFVHNEFGKQMFWSHLKAFEMKWIFFPLDSILHPEWKKNERLLAFANEKKFFFLWKTLIKILQTVFAPVSHRIIMFPPSPDGLIQMKIIITCRAHN